MEQVVSLYTGEKTTFAHYRLHQTLDIVVEDAKTSSGQGRRRKVVAVCIELLTVLSKEAIDERSGSRPFLAHGGV